MKKKFVLLSVVAVAVIMALFLAGCDETVLTSQVNGEIYFIYVGNAQTVRNQDNYTFNNIIMPQILKLSPVEQIVPLGTQQNSSTGWEVIFPKPIQLFITNSNYPIVSEGINDNNICCNSVITTTIVITSTVVIK